MQQKASIAPFLDEMGRITRLPSKRKTRLEALEYLAGKFEMKRMYTERQINEICGRWHTFGDYFLLRRELVDNGLLNREQDGSRYWRVWEDVPATVE